MKNIYHLDLSYNHLSGKIPSSLAKLNKSLFSLYLNNNELSGRIPSSFGKLYADIDFSYNRLTFDGMELVAQLFPNAIYSPQANIPLHQNNYGSHLLNGEQR